MKKMMRIVAAVCVIAVFTSFTPAQEEEVQTQVNDTKVETIACLK